MLKNSRRSEYTFRDDPQLLNIRLNIGMTGFGKSTLLRYQLARIQTLNRTRQKDRIIVVDPSCDDYHFDDFGRTLATASEVQQRLGPRTLRKYHLRVITRSLEVFDYLCWEAHRQEDVFLIIDEIWNFCPTKGGAQMLPPSFNLLVTESRHARIRILGTAQRPTQIHNNLLNLAQEVNVFRTEDLERLKQKLRTKENQERALRLARFEFFCCKQGEPVLCSVPAKS